MKGTIQVDSRPFAGKQELAPPVELFWRGTLLRAQEL